MDQKRTHRDTILEEIHRTREQIAERFGNDIGAIVEDARKRQEASGRPLWPSKPQQPKVAPRG